MAKPTVTCCTTPDSYCLRSDTIVGLEGVHVVAVVRSESQVTMTIETPREQQGCRRCGVVMHSHGRRTRLLRDIPCSGSATVLRWRQRTWACPDDACPAGTFTEELPSLARRREVLTTRAVWWAIGQLRREHATIEGLSRQLGVTWNTLWRVVEPRLDELAGDESRFAGVTTLGVDEHVWHHTPHRVKEKGPTMLTGMVDLTRDQAGRTHARLLDLVPGRTGKAFGGWLEGRGKAFCAGVKVVTLDPFRGYANAIDDHLDEAAPALDAFHVVKLGSTAMDEIRRRVQQATLNRRGKAEDPLFRIRNILHRALEHLTPRQGERLDQCLADGDPDGEVQVAWRCYQQLRATYQAKDTAEGKALAEKILETFYTCPIPEIARLGRTLRRWRKEFLGYSRDRPREQRRHRGDQRNHRTAPAYRTRISQRRSLPTTHAAGRRRTAPPTATLMSHDRGVAGRCRVFRH